MGVLDAAILKRARRKGAAPLGEIEAEAFDVLLSHPAGTAAVQRRVDAAISTSSTVAICESIAGVWGRLSAPGSVASLKGYTARRALGGAIAGPRVAFKYARQLVGGSWKDDDFKKAQKRHAEFIADGDPDHL